MHMLFTHFLRSKRAAGLPPTISDLVYVWVGDDVARMDRLIHVWVDREG
jgi:hypothetical protein